MKIKSKLKQWWLKFFYAYVDEAHREEIKSLNRQLQRQETVINEQAAYIQGFETCMKYNRVTINNGGK